MEMDDRTQPPHMSCVLAVGAATLR
jgi:hypothetical protein